MKNNLTKILSVIIASILCTSLLADELEIKSKQLKLNKDTEIVLAEGNVQISDKKNNIIFSEKAEYNKKNQLMRSFGETDIITSEKYRIQGTDIFYDNKNGIIYSKFKTKITDINGNEIFVNMFDYSITKKMFFSQGNIKILDNRKNEYLFSEIYIDEKERKIVGSNVKSFLNERTFKTDEKNEPRFFANSAFIEKEGSTYQKGIFTTCKNRGEDKCHLGQFKPKK